MRMPATSRSGPTIIQNRPEPVRASWPEGEVRPLDGIVVAPATSAGTVVDGAVVGVGGIDVGV